tara:strand:+ start:167 stop:718 length:552 start_codon:yes stop_codon:yes gene_type:complete
MKIIEEKTPKSYSRTVYVWKGLAKRKAKWGHDKRRVSVDQDNVYYAGRTTVDVEQRLIAPYAAKGYGKRDDVQLIALHEANESENSYELENNAIYTLTVFEKIMRSKDRKCECLNVNYNNEGERLRINMTLLKHLCNEHDIDFKDECRKLKQEKIKEAQDEIQELKAKINKLKKLSLDKVWST